MTQLQSVTCHTGSHSVTCRRHKWTHPVLTPAMQAGTRFTYPGGMEGWVDLVDLIAPRPGVEPATFQSRVRRRTAAPPRQPLEIVTSLAVFLHTCNAHCLVSIPYITWYNLHTFQLSAIMLLLLFYYLPIALHDLWLAIGMIFLSLSVSPSVRLCIAAKRYILQQVSEQVNRKCPLRTWFYNFQPPTPILSLRLPSSI